MWVVGGGFLWKIREKGRGEGGGWWVVGWGQPKELASQCTRVCQNYPLANYPLVYPRPMHLQASVCIFAFTSIPATSASLVTLNLREGNAHNDS